MRSSGGHRRQSVPGGGCGQEVAPPPSGCVFWRARKDRTEKNFNFGLTEKPSHGIFWFSALKNKWSGHLNPSFGRVICPSIEITYTRLVFPG
jgi:hypothetical protein